MKTLQCRWLSPPWRNCWPPLQNLFLTICILSPSWMKKLQHPWLYQPCRNCSTLCRTCSWPSTYSLHPGWRHCSAADSPHPGGTVGRLYRTCSWPSASSLHPGWRNYSTPDSTNPVGTVRPSAEPVPDHLPTLSILEENTAVLLTLPTLEELFPLYRTCF